MFQILDEDSGDLAELNGKCDGLFEIKDHKELIFQ